MGASNKRDVELSLRLLQTSTNGGVRGKGSAQPKNQKPKTPQTTTTKQDQTTPLPPKKVFIALKPQNKF